MSASVLRGDTPIFVAGHRGLVGSAVCRLLETRGCTRVITRPRSDLDLRDPAAVDAFLKDQRPEIVVLAAARVGGIVANSTLPADFITDNLQIAAALIPAAHRHGVKKLLNLGSSCIYPRLAPQPISEDSLLTGPLEPTNRAYAVAKIAAIEMCDSFRAQHGADFISAMPTNLYGPGDNFDLEHSHVLPAMIRRFHEAARDGREVVTLWGTGSPKREFLYVDDLAEACLFLLEQFSGAGPINVGTGQDVSIRELAELVAGIVGYTGRIEWDTSRPDGTPRKLLDVTRLTALGWTAPTSLRDGIARTVEWYLQHATSARGV